MPASSNSDELKTVTLAETDNFLVWTAAAEDGEVTYNLELGNVTLHMFQEEWDEFLQLVRSLKKA